MAQKTLLTAEQFYREYSGKDGCYELVQGEVVTMTPPGMGHAGISLTIGSLVRDHVSRHHLGWVGVEGGFVLSPNTVRGPDVAFIRSERVPAGGPPEGYFAGAPDLAIEVVSPSDTASELEVRVREYLEAGAAQVWVFYPKTRSVLVRGADGTARWYREQDTLEGGDLLPGFSVPIRDFFS